MLNWDPNASVAYTRNLDLVKKIVEDKGMEQKVRDDMDINNMVHEILRKQRDDTEKTLAEIITKYDFIVGSEECKHKLMEVLPDGANVIYSPYFKSSTIIYAIKKFDISDLLVKSQESEDKKCSES